MSKLRKVDMKKPVDKKNKRRRKRKLNENWFDRNWHTLLVGGGIFIAFTAVLMGGMYVGAAFGGSGVDNNTTSLNDTVGEIEEDLLDPLGGLERITATPTVCICCNGSCNQAVGNGSV